MLYLCLAILSSCAIALLMRVSADRITGRLSMLGANYLICSLLGAAYAGFDLVCPNVPGFAATVALGIEVSWTYHPDKGMEVTYKLLVE